MGCARCLHPLPVVPGERSLGPRRPPGGTGAPRPRGSGHGASSFPAALPREVARTRLGGRSEVAASLRAGCRSRAFASCALRGFIRVLAGIPKCESREIPAFGEPGPHPENKKAAVRGACCLEVGCTASLGGGGGSWAAGSLLSFAPALQSAWTCCSSEGPRLRWLLAHSPTTYPQR